jgi:hypothetical protein
VLSNKVELPLAVSCFVLADRLSKKKEGNKPFEMV